jgi:hypothetical protein
VEVSGKGTRIGKEVEMRVDLRNCGMFRSFRGTAFILGVFFLPDLIIDLLLW